MYDAASMRRLILTVVLSLGLVSVASAQDFEAAGRHFSAAQEAFGAKHFKTAAAEFEAAYAITRDPVLLYNIGESYQKAGQGRQAVAGYKKYLHDQTNAPDKAEVQRRIAEIEAKGYKLPDQSAPGDNPPAATPAPPERTTPALPATATPPATTPPPAATPPPPPTATPPPAATMTPPPATTPPPAPEATAPTPGPEKVAPGPTTSAPEPAAVPAPAAAPAAGLLDEGPMTKLRAGAWIGVATTLALLTAGAVLGLAAEDRSDEISRNLSFVDMNGQPHKFDQAADKRLRDLKDDGNVYNGLAIGFYSAAAASAVVTTVLFVVDAKRPRPSPHALRLSPVVGRSAAGLGLGGTF